MKKILVVDDTQENIDAAKLFFSTITGFEFIYATNRKDAELRLDEVYAVITDRSLPSNADVKIFDCEIPEKEMDVALACTIQANGYHILYSAHLKGKPVVMATEHGCLGMVLPVIMTELNEKQAYRWDTDPKNFSLENLITEIDESPSYEAYKKLWRYGNFGAVKHLGWHENIKKTDVEGWKIIWEELIKQF